MRNLSRSSHARERLSYMDLEQSYLLSSFMQDLFKVIGTPDFSLKSKDCFRTPACMK